MVQWLLLFPAMLPPASITAFGEVLLRESGWQCASTPPGAYLEPDALDVEWRPAAVPGTAAGALRDAGEWAWGVDDSELFDGRDWWYRCQVDVPGDGRAEWALECDGLATLAEVWVDGVSVLRSDNMWLAHRVELGPLPGRSEIVMRFAALDPYLALRRPRPRWRTRLARHQHLRWVRTSLVGRVPSWARWAAPVGPWRPVRLVASSTPRVIDRRIEASWDGSGGTLTAWLAVAGVAPGTPVELRLGDARAAGVAEAPEEPATACRVGPLRLSVAGAEPWWPHTHGTPALHTVIVSAGGEEVERFDVGFRTVELRRDGGDFELSVNGVPVFCRGACWGAPDAVSLQATDAELRRSLELLRDAGANMVRVGGYTHYQSGAFWDLCDELGLLVWQDMMLASYDPPTDAGWEAAMLGEARAILTDLSRRPSLAVACGSSETYQQAAMMGLAPAAREAPLLEAGIARVAAEVVPGVPYVASAPSGGEPPFDPSSGVAHYFGVGAYLRPVGDARRSGVRFAAECLAFAVPPEPATVEEVYGGPEVAGHDPRWKAAVARDPGTSWDFEDVVDHYVRQHFDVDSLLVRMADPGRALDMARAVICELMAATMGEWRREESICRGALILSWQDLWPGAGWGLLDSLGRPKAPWYVLRRMLQPRAMWMTDEGLAGLHLHVANERPETFSGHLALAAVAPDGTVVADGEADVALGGRSAQRWSDAELLGGFRDLTAAYRFGPPAHAAVVARLTGPGGELLGEAVHPVSPVRPGLSDPGLAATLRLAPGGGWLVDLHCDRPAWWVALDVEGWRPADNWLHLVPGFERSIELLPDAAPGAPTPGAPRVVVRALNSPGPIRAQEAPHE